jgi:hypothetical protein
MALPSRLTEHFSLAEVEHSETASRFGYDNSLPVELLEKVMNTAEGMERVRSLLGSRPLTINSWYRSLAVNSHLGAKPTSQHVRGEAVDFICPPFGDPLKICKSLIGMVKYIAFDQLILEHTWVHISFNSLPGATQKNEVLSLLETGTYALGLTDKKGNPL